MWKTIKKVKTMEDEIVEIYANIKQIDNELKALLEEREKYRQILCEMLPCIENAIPEIELKPKEYIIESDKEKHY